MQDMVHGKWKKIKHNQKHTIILHISLHSLKYLFDIKQTKDLLNIRTSIDSCYHDEQAFSAEKRRAFVRSILEQQDEQKRIGLYDPRGLSQMSKACSKISKQRARQSAEDNARQLQETIDCIDEVLEILSVDFGSMLSDWMYRCEKRRINRL